MTTRDNLAPGWPRGFPAVLVALATVGLVGFAVGVRGDEPLAHRAWQIYLVNYLFWTGVAVGGVVLTGIWHVTHSVWGKAFQGLAVAGAGFFPLSLVLFLPLVFAGDKLFPWAKGPGIHPAVWLNPTRVFVTNGFGLVALFAVAGLFVYYRLRSVGLRRAADATEQSQAEDRLSRLAPVLFIVYALVLSLLAFDLIMALDPTWYSTLFGGYFFFGGIYAGLAWLAVLAVFLFRGQARALLAPAFLHPIGKLMFGFAMFHGMLFYSQYLPIWYGNLPEEIEFVILRSQEGFWPIVSVAFLLASLLLPFSILLSRRVKENPYALAAVALVVLVGMWLDKFLLIVPSLWHRHEFPFGWLEAAITAGFAALVLLGYWGFSRYFPLLHYEPSRLAPHH